ncbi:STAS domain-containing protein [Bacillus massiliglaciei]|uniref:STAS domain-containing protein n=1 Tax=Bacillus massiliglaciei TaxID=1816693 RepID=UPI000DA5FDFF|nr:STAS domain-containing protein [Bacillus massiliglaciei]
MEELKLLGEKLEKNKYILAEHLELFTDDDDTFNMTKGKQIRAHLIQIHADALWKDKEKALRKMEQMGGKIGDKLVSAHYSLESLIEETQFTRNLFWSFIEEEVSNRYYPMEVLLKAISIIDEVLDVFIHFVSRSFVNHYKKIADVANESLRKIQESQTVIEELSTPIVQTVLYDVLLVPVIGRINEERMNSMIPKVLQKSSEISAETVIVDFSGITHVTDEHLFFFLVQMNGALKLMGTETIYVGFNPELVRKITENDMVANFKTFLSFSQAMNHLFKQRGLALQPLK